jgi:small subunit ribosomal protein S17
MKEKKSAEKKKFRRKLVGEVVKLSSLNTVNVRVESKFRHPKYGKIIKSHKKYLVHATDIKDIVVGSLVEIEERSPISKRKTWQVINIMDSSK